jgi:hypothetical protein
LLLFARLALLLPQLTVKDVFSLEIDELCLTGTVLHGMQKLNRGFSQLRDTELDNKAQTIITAIQGGTVLALPNPALTAVITALTDYQAALAMPGKTPARDAAVAATRVALENSLQMLAATLEMLAGVTDEQLATTGFDLPKVRTKTEAPVEAPTNARLKATGTSGQVQVLCDSVERAKAYEAQFALDPNATQWTDAGTFPNTRSITIQGLQRAKDYWVRVRAVGPNGPGAWSDPATILVA